MKMKVVVIDDSVVFRELIKRGLESDKGIEIVGLAQNPFEAVKIIEQEEPHIIICDIEMPRMSGIDFIKQILPQYPVPIIVVSANPKGVIDALNAGAVEFISKPNIQSPIEMENFIKDVITKIKLASNAKIIHQDLVEAPKTGKDYRNDDKIIAIGASTGGTESIFHLLNNLSVKVPGIVIVQHIPPKFSKMFAERLNSQTNFEVVEGRSGELILPGKVIIAPGDQHMAVQKVGNSYRVEVFSGDRINGHCPSVDVLFDSVARTYGNMAVGVILTGMGYDGAKGLLAMKRRGARTIGQDEKSCVVYGMPKAAFEVGAVEKQGSLNDIPQLIYRALT